jgi:hypothetical protein
MYTVTCRTDGCANNGIPLDMWLQWQDENGDTQVSACYCGVCGQQISDIQAVST